MYSSVYSTDGSYYEHRLGPAAVIRSDHSAYTLYTGYRPRCEAVQKAVKSACRRSRHSSSDFFQKIGSIVGGQCARLGWGLDHFCYASLPHRQEKCLAPYRRNLILEYDLFSRIRCTFLHFVTLFHTFCLSWPHSFDRYATVGDSSCTLSHYTLQ